MFIRLLFLLLVAANLGAAAWLLLGPSPVQAFPPPADPGVPELRLLSEVPQQAQPPAVAAVATTPAQPPPPPPPPDACATLGPFTTAAGMRAAMQNLSPRVARIQYREVPVQRSHGYWVYLPAAASREAALDEARKLATKGITDYYVVTAGDTQNTISLGLFNNPANAQKRLATLQGLGFAAKLEQRVDTESAYWVDYAVAAGSTFDWQAWVPGRDDLRAKAIDCF